MKVKIIKKGAEVKQKGKPVNEARSKRAAAREMVANVSDWVSDLQDRGYQVQNTTYPFLLDDFGDGDTDIQDVCNIPMQGIEWDRVAPCAYSTEYSSLVGLFPVSPYWVYTYAKSVREYYGDAATVAVGLVRHDGRPGYDSPDQLAADIAAAKAAGVPRFLFSSSCSNYGASGDGFLDEDASFNPVTPYAESKVWVERDVSRMADDTFSPTFLRNATAYGVSSRLRGDLVVNNLTGYAFISGKVLIKSDGMPWRPLVHIEDIALAFKCILEAPRDLVHNEAFNVGLTSENYRIHEVADMVQEIVPGSSVTYASDASPDARNYRVNCDKILNTLTNFKPRWTVRKGIEQLYAAYRSQCMSEEDFLGPRYQRVKHVKELIAAGRLDSRLQWQETLALQA